MIRLPSTSIVLGASDIADFEKRRKQRREGVPEDPPRVRRSNDSLRFLTLRQSTQDSCPSGPATTSPAKQLTSQRGILPVSFRDPFLAYRLSREEPLSPTSTSSEDEPSNSTPVTPRPTEENGRVDPGSPTAPSQASSPAKDDFYYGGYMESLAREISGNTARGSSNVLDDASTPQQPELPERQRLRSGSRLPRSPLFYTHNASISPERRPTSSLTPRVTSRVATHHTPGIIFMQPARRPTRRSPRRFRHQTNSFSFDESERASAAYEQERLPSNSTTGSTPRPLDGLSLHDELQGSSLQSSRITSGARSSAPSPSNFADSTMADLGMAEGSDAPTAAQQADRAMDTSQAFSLFSEPSSAATSPQLPLPTRPFSTVSRSVSGPEFLPGNSNYSSVHPLTSPLRSPSASPMSIDNTGAISSLGPSSPYAERNGELMTSPNSSEHGRYIFRTLSRMARVPRTRSPSHHSMHSRSSSTPYDPPLQQPLSSSPPYEPPLPEYSSPNDPPPPYTPSRSYHVYDDSLPSSSQPQTPANLPEARHRSRFHPSYTAPTTRASARLAALTVASPGDRPSTGVFQPETPSRQARHRDRRSSPIGLIVAGFQGLYGGHENGNDEQNWVEGHVDHARARQRLRRNAVDEGRPQRRLSRTPEAEDWRARGN